MLLSFSVGSHHSSLKKTHEMFTSEEVKLGGFLPPSDSDWDHPSTTMQTAQTVQTKGKKISSQTGSSQQLHGESQIIFQQLNKLL